MTNAGRARNTGSQTWSLLGRDSLAAIEEDKVDIEIESLPSRGAAGANIARGILGIPGRDATVSRRVSAISAARLGVRGPRDDGKVIIARRLVDLHAVTAIERVHVVVARALRVHSGGGERGDDGSSGGCRGCGRGRDGRRGRHSGGKGQRGRGRHCVDRSRAGCRGRRRYRRRGRRRMYSARRRCSHGARRGWRRDRARRRRFFLSAGAPLSPE